MRFVIAVVAALLLAAPSGHLVRAQRAETLGRMDEAAREYEAAYLDDHDAEALYRLGIVRRKLKQYAKAREAFRGYLREAPEGPLREEVERQLAKLEVLIEAQQDDFARPAHPKPAPKPLAPVAAPPPVPAPVAPPVPAPVVAEPPHVEVIEAPSPAAKLPEAVVVAPPAPPAKSSRPSARWLAAGAAGAGAAGAVLWWDGARVSRNLDARFDAGELTAADGPSYGRARNEGVAGRVLVAAGAALLAGAVALWW